MNQGAVEKAPARLLVHGLGELFRWYETNLCGRTLLDPRGHTVVFDPGRFPYLVKLRNQRGGKVSKPLKVVNKIKCNQLSNEDFGGFDPERAQTLPWLIPMILRPTLIVANLHLYVPGDESYIKEFDKEGYRYKTLVCRRISERPLVPVTSFPMSKLKLEKRSVIWPK